MTHQAELALAGMQQYLQDEIAPAAAAGAVAALMAQPPEVLMQHVSRWVVEQAQRDSLPVADLLLHALTKVYVTGELGLLDREAVANYLDRIMTLALRMCPAEQREPLRARVMTMRISRTTAAARPQPPAIRLPTLTDVVKPAAADDETSKRFSFIVDRLQRQMQSGGAQAPPPADLQTFAQLLTMAASQSQTSAQFSDYVKMIQPLDAGKEGNIFVILGGAVPSWDIAGLAPGQAIHTPAEVGAMEKIIDLAAEDPAETMARFGELVMAAIAKFNDGALGATLWMLDVADETIRERKLDPAMVERIRADAAAAISSVQLRKYAERGRYNTLKVALRFFPALALDRLLESLRGEPTAERRRSLLGFIEAYGPSAREAALVELERERQRGDADTYYLRNLIYILHRITRDPNADLDRELASLTAVTARGQNIYVIKEAATALGQIRTDAVVTLLTTRLAEFEALLLRSDATVYPLAEMQKLLERITGALARIGTSAALLTVARHGMKANALLGDTRARLSVLAHHDLSFDEPTVQVLLKALRDDLPGKLFGRLLPARQDSVVRLIEALSGTRHEAVEELFQDIAARFADQEVGRAAAAVLTKWQPAVAPSSSEPVPTLTGELEFFGLPSVLQSLDDMRATGMLTLRNKRREVISKLIICEGKFINARTGNIRGAEALYELLERPASGAFAFVPYPPEKISSATVEPLKIMPLLLEGVRRHDELQRLTALIPDQMTFVKGTVRPAPHEDEDDPELVRDVWVRVSSGLPMIECERQIFVDTFRIRRLVAHWMEKGALVAT
ncbi:MAG: DUF4388 domain-containing protein [Thermoanaerobaculia bacterium]